MIRINFVSDDVRDRARVALHLAGWNCHGSTQVLERLGERAPTQKLGGKLFATMFVPKWMSTITYDDPPAEVRKRLTRLRDALVRGLRQDACATVFDLGGRRALLQLIEAHAQDQPCE